MPRLTDEKMDMMAIGGSNFSFRGTRIEHLGATEYTLVTIAVDETGSVAGFADELRNMLVMAVEACKKSPRSDNILVRVMTFSSTHAHGVNEIHGFKTLAEINTADYPAIVPGGMTPLCDAVFSAIGATNAYGKKLMDDDFGVNGIAFVITDGGENASTATMNMVKDEAKKSITGETLESMISVLVGINTAGYANELANFQKEAGVTQFIDAQDATARKLAKLADFVSRSVSSQSQALGTGGPSKTIDPTI
ncbi:MAG: VWA domain-containing protein [Candidatus Azambacteria bacterium]|nr:VWA domain-containing protein [Candidatus Azambacteria bacterium]